MTKSIEALWRELGDDHKEHETFCRFMWKRTHKYGFRPYFFADLKLERAYLTVRFPKLAQQYATMIRIGTVPKDIWRGEIGWDGRWSAHWYRIDPDDDASESTVRGAEIRQEYVDFADQKLAEFAAKKQAKKSKRE